MGNYSVPEAIRKCKPSGTMVKRISGHYYVYEYLANQMDGYEDWDADIQKAAILNKMGFRDVQSSFGTKLIYED